MGPTLISGLPAHVLLVHFVVVLVPLSALLLLASALWPAARRRLGALTPLVALGSLALIPVTTHAGEWLQDRVDADPLVRAHTRIADGLLPWASGVFVVAAALWAVERLAARSEVRELIPADSTGPDSTGSGGAGTDSARRHSTGGTLRPRPGPGSRSALTGMAARAVLAALALVIATGSVVEVYRIGESGSRAAWHDAYQSQPARSR